MSARQDPTPNDIVRYGRRNATTIVAERAPGEGDGSFMVRLISDRGTLTADWRRAHEEAVRLRAENDGHVRVGDALRADLNLASAEADRLRGELATSATMLAQEHATAIATVSTCNRQTAALVRIHAALDNAAAPAGPPEVRIADLALARDRALAKLSRIGKHLDAAGHNGGPIDERVASAIADARRAHEHIDTLNRRLSEVAADAKATIEERDTARALAASWSTRAHDAQELTAYWRDQAAALAARPTLTPWLFTAALAALVVAGVVWL